MSFIITNSKNVTLDEKPKKYQPDALRKEYKCVKGDYISFVKEYNSIKTRRLQGTSSKEESIDYELTPKEEEALKNLQSIWKKISGNGGLDIMNRDNQELFYDMSEFHQVLDLHLKGISPTWVKYTKGSDTFRCNLLGSNMTTCTYNV